MMRYKLLGKSGLRVSEMALGTMTFGTVWGWGADKETSRQIFNAYVDAGGNFIDTANNYTDGTSEEWVGEFIHHARDRYVVATKYTLRDNSQDAENANQGGNSRKSLVGSVERSLQRLQTDHIDLLYLHMWDFTTPVDEVLRALDDLVRAGKVLYVGFSDSPAWIIAYAIALAEQQGWTRPIATQLPYNLISRDAERALIPMARTLDVSVTAWALLGGGVLTGKYRQADATTRYEGASEKALTAADKLVAFAAEIGRSPSQVAINWVRQQNRVIPILGARTLAQMEDNLGALDFRLTETQMVTLNAMSDFQPGFPLSFLTGDNVINLVFGDTYDRLDDHRRVVG